MKDQVAAVLDLVHRVGIAESAALPLIPIQRQAQTRVNPALADLAQAPYSPGFGQGVCDLRQVCGPGNDGETVALLGKADTGLPRLAGHVDLFTSPTVA